MKRLLAILCCAIGISAYALDYTPMQATAPSATMQSVNNNAYMSSGSNYTSSVCEVGAATPSRAAGPRKVAPGTDDSGHDPSNPNFGPVGDALIPLLLMVVAYAAFLLLRRRTRNV